MEDVELLSKLSWYENDAYYGLTKEMLKNIKNKIQNNSFDGYDFVVDFEEISAIKSLINSVPVTDAQEGMIQYIWEQYITVTILKECLEQDLIPELYGVDSLYKDLMSRDYNTFKGTELIDMYTISLLLRSFQNKKSRIHYFIDGELDACLKQVLDNIYRTKSYQKNIFYTTEENKVYTLEKENVLTFPKKIITA